MSSGIYVIRNLVNDKLYVGKSVHIENRWLEHQSDLRNGRHANIHLQRAHDKYGPDNLLISHKKIPTDHKADGDNCLLRYFRLSFIGVKIKSFIIE